ncbi:MAG: hypothetical protein A2Z20_04435 [Bdellovibrionales bacterium RBG_16_40_8]|nr:MAG: hypothetical protein A2Z20_04435 [Bdellovibrionales bacterium RBG_16_40_8]
MKNNLFVIAITLLMALSIASTALADLEWSGLYRAEGNSIVCPAFGDGLCKRKEYATHILMLRPKIVAADGFIINAQLNIFNSDKYNQLGAYFGDGLGSGASTSINDSSTVSENQKSEDIKVTQFYLTHKQENAALVVGRVPLQFGLGMTYNAGNGLFDHYSDTRDLVGYKITMGNFFLMPSYAKIHEGNLSGYDDTTEINFQLQYENPEIDATMGVFYQNRHSSQAGNDTPPEAVGGLTANGQYNSKNFNIFYKKETDNYFVGFELAQQGGSTGVNNISLSGFGAALEYEFHPKEHKNIYGVKAGMATGDNPKTTKEYEGFIFDRNYDVAMLLFNHGLGQADLLHTKLLGRTDLQDSPAPDYNTTTVNGEPDVEAISNVTYLSPYFKRKWSDRWSMTGALTIAWLNDDTVTVGGTDYTTSTDLGYEIDLSINYNISEKITWLNQLGYFSPGDAWKAGNNNFSTGSIFGFVTKAAVSF